MPNMQNFELFSRMWDVETGQLRRIVQNEALRAENIIFPDIWLA